MGAPHHDMNIVGNDRITAARDLASEFTLFPPGFGRRGGVWLCASVVRSWLLDLNCVPARAQTVTVNPVTNKIYVANYLNMYARHA
jgi:hypothetical protein